MKKKKKNYSFRNIKKEKKLPQTKIEYHKWKTKGKLFFILFQGCRGGET